MEQKDNRIGRRFSELYIERGAPLPDSPRFRRRLAAYFRGFGIEDERMAAVIKQDLGVEVPRRGIYRDMDRFFEQAEPRDVLDSVTSVYGFLIANHQVGPSSVWVRTVRQVLAEENMGYTVDDKGVMHYSVDAEFERNREATVRGLGAARLAAVLTEFQAANQRLEETPPDTKACVRSAFEAVEILVKLLTEEGKVKVLGPAEVERFLRPKVAKAFAGNEVARNAANAMLTAFSSWVVGAQPYRHGQRVEEPSPPPLALAVAFLSSAATYIRWLLEIVQSTHEAEGKPE
jgi:hypothetical protein